MDQLEEDCESLKNKVQHKADQLVIMTYSDLYLNKWIWMEHKFYVIWHRYGSKASSMESPDLVDPLCIKYSYLRPSYNPQNLSLFGKINRFFVNKKAVIYESGVIINKIHQNLQNLSSSLDKGSLFVEIEGNFADEDVIYKNGF